jgi:hypothetical protein
MNVKLPEYEAHPSPLYIKDLVFVPPLPANVELRTQITAAVAEVMQETLHSVWQESDYK